MNKLRSKLGWGFSKLNMHELYCIFPTGKNSPLCRQGAISTRQAHPTVHEDLVCPLCLEKALCGTHYDVLPEVHVSETVTFKGEGLNPQSIPKTPDVAVKYEEFDDNTVEVKELLGYPLEFLNQVLLMFPPPSLIDTDKYDYRLTRKILAGDDYWSDLEVPNWMVSKQSFPLKKGIIVRTPKEPKVLPIPEGIFEISSGATFATYTADNRTVSLPPGKYQMVNGTIYSMEVYDART